MWKEKKVRFFINNTELLTYTGESAFRLHQKINVFGETYIVASIQNDWDESIIQILLEDVFNTLPREAQYVR